MRRKNLYVTSNIIITSSKHKRSLSFFSKVLKESRLINPRARMRGNKKTFALTAVHPAYACEATTAKEPARSQVAELEPWKSRPAAIPTIHKVQRHRRGRVRSRLYLMYG